MASGVRPICCRYSLKEISYFAFSGARHASGPFGEEASRLRDLVGGHAAALRRVLEAEALDGRSKEKGNVPEVVSHIEKIHTSGTGVLGMKIIGEGAFKSPEQRDASIKFVMQLGAVDAITIGFKNTGEVDEAIERMNTHLNV